MDKWSFQHIRELMTPNSPSRRQVTNSRAVMRSDFTDSAIRKPQIAQVNFFEWTEKSLMELAQRPIKKHVVIHDALAFFLVFPFCKRSAPD
jgi:hypothetical protein